MLIKIANEADVRYALHLSGDSNIASLMKLDRSAFGDVVGRMSQLVAPECEDRLPRHLESQAYHVHQSYENMSEYLELIESGLKRMTHLQYSARRRSLLAASGFAYPITDIAAMHAFQSVTKSSIQKLERMIAVYPKYIRPDRSDVPTPAPCS